MKGDTVLRSGAVMAAGTVASRVTGLGRAWLIGATLGLSTAAADIFNVPNTIPNALYILVAGGVLNSVLVPQLVHKIREDADGGEAYAQRVFTAVTLVLLAATIAATAAAPWLLRLYVNDKWLAPELAPQFDAMVSFARFCLPQIFFYGLYVLLGQLLNARGSFGPMMWAPVLNNVVAVAVFGSFLLTYGTHPGASFTAAEVRWLGLGSTLGIAVQALVLLPVVRRTGLRLRFRFDLKGTGLGTIGRLGFWTLLFVGVNQLGYLVVVNLASGASAEVASGAAEQGAGYSVYSLAFLLLMVPHAIITVSLATALLPRMSAQVDAGDEPEVAAGLASTIRTCLAIIVPVAVTLVFAARPLVHAVFDVGAARGGTTSTATTLVCFLPGLIAFTVHYLVLRGFYAYRDTRTPFFVQVGLVAVNVTLALALVPLFDSRETAVALALAYSGGYAVGAGVSLAVLRRAHLPSLRVALWPLAWRLTVAAVPTACACWGTSAAGYQLLGRGNLGELVIAVLVVGVGLTVFLAAAVALGIREVTDALDLVLQRVRPHATDGRHVRGSRRATTRPPSMSGASEDL